MDATTLATYATGIIAAAGVIWHYVQLYRAAAAHDSKHAMLEALVNGTEDFIDTIDPKLGASLRKFIGDAQSSAGVKNLYDKFASAVAAKSDK